MTNQTVFSVPADSAAGTRCDKAKYLDMYRRSIEDPEGFWGEHGRRIDWIKPYTKVKRVSFDIPNVSIKWFEDGTLNVSANCLDRHLATRGDQTAIIWESDDPANGAHVTYRDLHERVCRLANAMKARGVKKDDRVTLYMPMIPETAVAMLACARVGAIHSIVFGGFSPDSLAARIRGCDSNCVITADEGPRGGRKVPLKANADKAMANCPSVETCIVVKRTGGDVPMRDGRDVWYEDICAAASPDCPPEEMNAEDPLFILYTSGSTGAPKGVMHTTGGYLVYAAMTHEYVFDDCDGDIIAYRRRRLGDRAFLYRLWSARQWRDDPDVRGRAQLSGDRPVLERGRQAQGQHFLHRADGHPVLDEGRRGARKTSRRTLRILVRWANRSTPRPGLGITTWSATTLPDRRYLVANGNRRYLISPLPGATDLSLFRHAALFAFGR